MFITNLIYNLGIKCCMRSSLLHKPHYKALPFVLVCHKPFTECLNSAYEC